MPAEHASLPRPGLTRKSWALIILLSFFGQVAWALENNFFNLFIQDAFGASLSDVALMVSASALTATATTLFAGAWSDRVGRRKAFIGVGTVLWGASIIVFAYLQSISSALAGTAAAAMAFGVTLTIVFDCVMTFFGSLANDSCFNAWITDITCEENRGRVEGVNSAMPLLAMLAVFGGALFFMIVRPDGTVTYDYPLFFTIVGVAVMALGAGVLLFMDDSAPGRAPTGGYLASALYGFRPQAVRENRMLYLVLLGYLVFATALQVFMPYYVLYLRLPYILGESYVFVMAPGIAIAAVFTILYGKRVDACGFRRAVVLPLLLFVAGCVVLTLLTGMAGVFAGSVLMLCGYLGGGRVLRGGGAQQHARRARGVVPGRAHLHGRARADARGAVDRLGFERGLGGARVRRGGRRVHAVVAHLPGRCGRGAAHVRRAAVHQEEQNVIKGDCPLL